MAFRAVRTAAATLLLLLAVGCAPADAPDGEDGAARLPPDTVRLSARDLARLPWYGVQRLACREVEKHLKSAGYAAATDTVEISREGDSLAVDPTMVVMVRGDTIHWRSDSLVWVARFMDRSPFADGALTVRGRGVAGKSARGQARPREAVSVVRRDSAGCGRYYFFVAAYHPDRPGRVYLADPPGWEY